MAINPIVHNTGGQYRFIDYVSYLPEFLQEETDVVTLMQVFSDYLNNAYRNTEIATKFEIKLIATEGLVGRRTKELSKLVNLFIECEKRDLPILYLFKPVNPATYVVQYDGDNEFPNVNIVPGGVLVGESIYIEYSKYPERSGVYVGADVTGSTTPDPTPATQLLIDPNGRSQDPFTKTSDKPLITSVGYAPRMIEFRSHNIGDIQYRKVAENNGVVYFEVFFSVDITDVKDVPSLDNYIVSGNVDDKYLVDYYNYLGLNYPNEYNYGKYKIEFIDEIDGSICIHNPFDGGRGIFYARDLTREDVRDTVIDAEGYNKNIDPSFRYKENDITPNAPDTRQLYYSINDVNPNKLYLKLTTTFVEGTFTDESELVGKVITRLNVGDVKSTFDMNTVDLLTNQITLTEKTNLKIGDYVQFITDGSAPLGLNNDSTNLIESISDDGLTIKLKNVDFTGLGTGIGELNRLTVTQNAGKVLSVDSITNPITFTFSYYAGNMITDGDFAIMKGNKIHSRIRLSGSNTLIWSNNPTQTYLKGQLIYHNRTRYRALKTIPISDVPGIPVNEPAYYIIDMNGISTYAEEIKYNPYMFGAYGTRTLKYDQKIDFNIDSLETLYNQLIIQESQQTGLVYRFPQREWILNPRLINDRDFKRNGWMSIYKNVASLNTDIANESASQYEIDATNVSYLGNRVYVKFTSPHNWNVGDYINIISPNEENIAGIYPITTIPTDDSLTFNIPTNLGDTESTVTNVVVSNVDYITKGTVVFSTENLFTVSELNPKELTDGTYYKYTLNNVEWKRFSSVNPTITQSIPIDVTSPLYGEFTEGVYTFKDGEVIELTNQTNPYDNGLWRVKKNAKWGRLGNKLTLKVREIEIDAIELDEDTTEADESIFYTRYTTSSVGSFISSNKNSFILGFDQAYEYKFDYPVIDDIDTTYTQHKIFNSKFDSNSVSAPSHEFKGIPDMKYPILEKIERLMYQKDPNVIDFELIGYLARFMGYYITPVAEDVMQSEMYSNQLERETAIRKVIQSLPEYNSLKATEKGLETLLLTFGIIGKIINIWTEQSNPYNIFIPDYDTDAYRYSEMEQGNSPNLIPTPHFKVEIDVEGNFKNMLGIEDIGRISHAINKYKPINTVFKGIEAYMKLTTTTGIWTSPMDAHGMMQCDIGYDITFDEIIDNCSI